MNSTHFIVHQGKQETSNNIDAADDCFFNPRYAQGEQNLDVVKQLTTTADKVAELFTGTKNSRDENEADWKGSSIWKEGCELVELCKEEKSAMRSVDFSDINSWNQSGESDSTQKDQSFEFKHQHGHKR